MKTAYLWLCAGSLFAGSPARADEPEEIGDPGPSDEELGAVAGPEQPWNQGVSMAERQAARALFLDGNRLARVPLFAQAAERYRAALARWRHPAFYFNLAIAQLNLDQEAEAYESLLEAMRYGEAPLGAEQYAEAAQQLAELKRLLGRIRVTCQTPGAEVTLDGMPLFVCPGSYEGWVKARPHELTAKKAGYLAEARQVTVAPAQEHRVDFKLVTLRQATDASRRWATWKPWAVVAAGAAIVAGGGGLHALAAQNFNDFDVKVSGLSCEAASGRPPEAGCSRAEIGPSLHAQLQRAERQQIAAVSSYAIGGSLIAAGAALLYMNRPRQAEQSRASRSAGRVDIAPAMSSGALGILVTVRR